LDLDFEVYPVFRLYCSDFSEIVLQIPFSLANQRRSDECKPRESLDGGMREMAITRGTVNGAITSFHEGNASRTPAGKVLSAGLRIEIQGIANFSRDYGQGRISN
jgi:hypothetical protein